MFKNQSTWPPKPVRFPVDREECDYHTGIPATCRVDGATVCDHCARQIEAESEVEYAQEVRRGVH